VSYFPKWNFVFWDLAKGNKDGESRQERGYHVQSLLMDWSDVM